LNCQYISLDRNASPARRSDTMGEFAAMNNKLKSSAITRLALLAVGNKEAALLCMMVDRHIGEDFVIGLPASADIAILDGDAEGYRDALDTWRADRPGAPAVVLSAGSFSPSPGVVHIRKPLQASELAAVLNECRSGGRPAEVASLVLHPQALADTAPDSSTALLSVAICMSMDPFEVFDTIGIRTDFTGGIRYPGVADAPMRREFAAA
jgi:hypothetical protein